MQLRIARLCIDCEEIHDSQQCPVCASEAFEYVTRWIPVRERRAQKRPAVAPSLPANKGKLVGYGVLGLGIVGLTQWIVKGRKMIEDAATRNAGELK
jgi:predicted  nucleic acid-binding Zn-ribbon protein